MKTLIPLGDKVIIQIHRDPGQTQGGLVIPDGARQEKDLGTVVHIGPLVQLVKKGDTVLFSSYAGQKFEYRGETYRILHEEDIHAQEVDDGIPEGVD